MTITFSVSPLSKIATRTEPATSGVIIREYTRPAPNAPPAPVEPDPGVVSAPAGQIIAWRSALSMKYAAQLGEPLAWSETSPVLAEEYFGSALLSLDHVAGVLDLKGEAAAVGLATRDQVSMAEIIETQSKIFASGFTALRFPQLLLGADIWLPYQENLVIEEPDWNAKIRRFGSSFCLAAELDTLLGFIRRTDPNITERAARASGNQPTVFLAAWYVASALSRLTGLATSARVPLWTTG